MMLVPIMPISCSSVYSLYRIHPCKAYLQAKKEENYKIIHKIQCNKVKTTIRCHVVSLYCHSGAGNNKLCMFICDSHHNWSQSLVFHKISVIILDKLYALVILFCLWYYECVANSYCSMVNSILREANIIIRINRSKGMMAPKSTRHSIMNQSITKLVKDISTLMLS